MSESISIPIQFLAAAAPSGPARPPEKAHADEDAAFDLYAIEQVGFLPGDTKLVKTGLAMAIPEGHVGLVCSRSGMALHSGLIVLNAPGVIDPGYRGEIGVVMHKLPDATDIEQGGGGWTTIQPHHKVAQLLIVRTADVNFVLTPRLEESGRGSGGFGSTGR